MCSAAIFIMFMVGRTLCQEYVEVDTTGGRIRGHRMKYRHGLDMVDVFTGVPYARPPVGDLRFATPHPLPPRGDDVINATSYPPACPQDVELLKTTSYSTDLEYSEDCLYLNVFAPKYDRKHGEGEKHATMVWFHGGWYTIGTSAYFDGRMLALKKGVIIVTVNYRLGPLGFFSTNDDVAPGNYGLLDQVQALKWVQKNIASFGGDPSWVTIFGESAGGRSVGLHLLSPLSKGLFQAAIAMSGTGITPWSVHRDPTIFHTQTEKMAKAFGCNPHSSQSIVTCLRRKDASELVKYHVRRDPELRWAARIDDYFLSDLPEELVSKHYFHQVPVMLGNVQNEGSVKFTEETFMTKDGFNKTMTESIFRDYLTPLFGVKTYEVLKATMCKYRPSEVAAENRDLYMQLVSDVTYMAPEHHYAASHSQVQSATFMYYFTYRSSNDPKPAFLRAYHASEVPFVFGAPFWGEECPYGCYTKYRGTADFWNERDKAVSELMMTLWTNFAKEYDPNPVPNSDHYWPEYNEYLREYLLIDGTTKVSESLRHDYLLFWNDFITGVLAGDNDPSEACNQANKAREQEARDEL